MHIFIVIKVQQFYFKNALYNNKSEGEDRDLMSVLYCGLFCQNVVFLLNVFVLQRWLNSNLKAGSASDFVLS